MFGQILGGLAGSFLSGKMNKSSAKDAGDANAALQREFAQNGIRWKVKDAKKAGIHPLYALGAQTSAASPAYVGTSPGDGIAEMGQNIGRAIDVASTAPEKTQVRMNALQLEKAGLENDLLRSQIAQLNQNKTTMPSRGDNHLVAGQGNSSPTAQTHAVGNPARELPVGPDFGYTKTDHGGLAITPSEHVKARIEDQIVPESLWAMRNLHWSPPVSKPPRSLLPKGANGFVWNPLRQEWQAVYPWRHYLR